MLSHNGNNRNNSNNNNNIRDNNTAGQESLEDYFQKGAPNLW